jgi:hypothetical protein
VTDLLEWGPAADAQSQFEKVLSKELPVQELVEGAPSAPLLTDDRPVNEYYLLRRMSEHSDDHNIQVGSSVDSAARN